MPKPKAPVVIIDPTVLGDRLPRDKDSIAQKVEDTQNLRDKHHRIPGQDLLTNADMAQTNYLDPVEFQQRLRKLNTALKFAPGLPPYCVVGAVMLDDDIDSPHFGQIVVNPIACGFRADRPLPEFSFLGTDSWGIATSEKDGERGWRTVLIRLIQSGYLKYSAVKAEFGEPTGQRGKLWHEQLREYKQ